MEFNIKLAGKLFEIRAIHNYIKEYCKNYIVYDCKSLDNQIISIAITQEDIEYEKEKSKKEDMKKGTSIRTFSDEYLELLAVYRKIAEQMLDFDTLLFHGSVVAVDNEGYLFTAKSGTGKSTHTMLWQKYFGNRAVMVNDDKPLLQINNYGVVAYGTPWDGKHRLSTNISVPLKAVCILERGNVNYIQKCSFVDVYPMLLQQVYRPRVPEQMKKTLDLLDRLGKKVSMYKLKCNMDQDAVVVAYKEMGTIKKNNIVWREENAIKKRIYYT